MTSSGSETSAFTPLLKSDTGISKSLGAKVRLNFTIWAIIHACCRGLVNQDGHGYDLALRSVWGNRLDAGGHPLNVVRIVIRQVYLMPTLTIAITSTSHS